MICGSNNTACQMVAGRKDEIKKWFWFMEMLREAKFRLLYIE